MGTRIDIHRDRRRHTTITKLGDWWDIASQLLVAIVAIAAASAIAAGVGFLIFLSLLGGVS